MYRINFWCEKNPGWLLYVSSILLVNYEEPFVRCFFFYFLCYHVDPLDLTRREKKMNHTHVKRKNKAKRSEKKKENMKLDFNRV